MAHLDKLPPLQPQVSFITADWTTRFKSPMASASQSLENTAYEGFKQIKATAEDMKLKEVPIANYEKFDMRRRQRNYNRIESKITSTLLVTKRNIEEPFRVHFIPGQPPTKESLLLHNLEQRKKYDQQTKSMMSMLQEQKIATIERCMTEFSGKIMLYPDEKDHLMRMNSSKAIVTYIKNKIRRQEMNSAAILIQRMLRRVI